MRMMMKVRFPVEAGNKGIAEGTLPETVMKFVEAYKPEASYFVAEGGQRTGLFFFDMTDAKDIPSVAEPFLMNLEAAISITPAMDLADMKAGVEKAMQNK